MLHLPDTNVWIHHLNPASSTVNIKLSAHPPEKQFEPGPLTGSSVGDDENPDGSSGRRKYCDAGRKTRSALLLRQLLIMTDYTV